MNDLYKHASSVAQGEMTEIERQTHITKLRVRLSETDTLGVVYYGNYFTYFDVARLELLRAVGITDEYLKSLSVMFVAAEAHCKYFSSARFDDLLEVRTWISKLGKSSIKYEHAIFREDGVKLVEGYVVDVMVNKDRKPHPIPDEIREKLRRYVVETNNNR